jgi:serine/threonine protein kinase
MLTISRNRYLILDVLGQGTFGQVVKCQNLKTQEVVAVKVVKNRTAYFNQSMMEVSVLDLVRSSSDLSLEPANTLSLIRSWTRMTTTTSCDLKIHSSTDNIFA